MKNDLYAQVGESQLFEGCTQKEFEGVAALAQEKKLGKNGLLFSATDPSEMFYLLVKGKLEVKNEARIINTVTEGGVVGEVGAFTGNPRSATCRAMEDCELLEISMAALEKLFKKEPEVGLKLYRNVTRILSSYLKENDLVVEFYHAVEG